MSRSSTTLTLLNTFLHTAESGSFAAASRALGISAAAVGQNIKRLEDEFGIALFTRTTRKMSLTPEGSLLYQRARRPLRDLEEIEHLFDESRGEIAGPLRVTAPKRFATRTLVPLVTDFQRLHPRVQIELDASEAVRDFVDDPVDVAFRVGTPADATMIARHLSELPVFTLATPEYLAEHGAPTHPQDLSEHNCLAFRVTDTGALWNWAFTMDGEVQRIEPQGSFVTNDPDALVEAGLRGAGLMQMDGYYAGELVRSGQLVPVLTEYVATVMHLYLYYASRDRMPLRVRTFIDFVMDALPRDCYAASRILGAESG